MSNLPGLVSDNYSDEQLAERAKDILQESSDITIKAVRGYAIVAFLPYRRYGRIVVPDKHKDESVECIMIDDASGYEIPIGTKVICSRGDGLYFEVKGVRFCRIKGKALYAIEE